jgi:hypothetical protein
VKTYDAVIIGGGLGHGSVLSGAGGLQRVRAGALPHHRRGGDLEEIPGAPGCRLGRPTSSR